VTSPPPPPRKKLRVVAFGATPAEIEFCALDEALQFFGAAERLEIRPGWCAEDARCFRGGRESGKPYGALVIVELAG
jgi:hypothetical protein